MPRKHLIASQNNKKQQNQAKIWQKLAREIKAAVRVGGNNPDANPRLKAAIEKALRNNLSRDSIDRNVNGKADASEMSSCEFECYGPQGIQIIVGGLTDNMNRTIASLNGYLSKLHGEIAKTNSVKVFFDNNGYIAIEKTSDINQDKIMEETMEYGIVDIMELEDAFEIRTIPEDFYKVKDVLTKNNYKILEAELKLIPQNYISSLSDENKAKLERFIDCCDNDEDIQWCITNYQEEE